MPATVYLNWIEDALKRVHVIQGDAGNLVTSTVTSTATGLVATSAFEADSSRQVQIEMMLQVSNEIVQEAYSMGVLPKIASTATIALVAQQREYSLPSDFERLAGRTYEQRGIGFATQGYTILEYPGGYMQMLADQAMATVFIGQPNAYAISPGSDVLRMDREPTSVQAGMTMNFIYEKRVAFTATSEADALPFSPTVADQLVPVLAEAWNAWGKGQFDPARYRGGIAKAVAFMTRTQVNDRWGPQRPR
jgi:hypothetical protein